MSHKDLGNAFCDTTLQVIPQVGLLARECRREGCGEKSVTWRGRMRSVGVFPFFLEEREPFLPGRKGRERHTQEGASKPQQG